MCVREWDRNIRIHSGFSYDFWNETKVNEVNVINIYQKKKPKKQNGQKLEGKKKKNNCFKFML